MAWTVNTREPNEAIKFSHPRGALGTYLDLITKIDNDANNDNKKTAPFIDAVFELANSKDLHLLLPFVTITLPEEN